MGVGAYPWVARASIRRYSTYRVATLGSILENCVVSMLWGYVLLAVVRTTGTVHGLAPKEALTFAFVSGSIEASFWVTAPTEIDERIKTGDVVTDIQRPLDFQLYWLSHEAGRVVLMYLTRGIAQLAFGALVLHVLLPHDPGALALFVVTLTLGFVISFAWRFIVGLTGFWLLDTRGAVSLSGAIVTFSSGALLPLALLPSSVGRGLRWLPFAGIVQTPFDAFTGNRSVVGGIALQVVWAIVLLLVGRLMYRRALRRVVVQGG
jgi:ABC-2 type transport system permease protein